MPLVIDDVIIKETINLHPDAILQNFQKLHERSVKYVKDAEKVIMELEKSDRFIYVCQKEFASISNLCNKYNINFLASDDATTCHIVVLVERSTNSISLAHFDGADTERGFSIMVKELNELFQMSRNDTKPYKQKVFDMHIFGGFVDEKKYSENLFMELLSVCQKLEETINLKLACVYSVNSKLVNNKSCPIINGIAVNIQSGEILVVRCGHKEPDISLRTVRMTSTKQNKMTGIYDYKHCCLYVEPFIFKRSPYGTFLLQLPKERYLEICSTSPHCEPDHFVESSKSALIFAMKYEKYVREIFQKKARQYILNEKNEWILLNSDQMYFSS